MRIYVRGNTFYLIDNNNLEYEALAKDVLSCVVLL